MQFKLEALRYRKPPPAKAANTATFLHVGPIPVIPLKILRIQIVVVLIIWPTGILNAVSRTPVNGTL